jgi:hypothetical protein
MHGKLLAPELQNVFKIYMPQGMHEGRKDEF